MAGAVMVVDIMVAVVTMGAHMVVTMAVAMVMAITMDILIMAFISVRRFILITPIGTLIIRRL